MAKTIFELAGGEPAMRQLAAAFYARMFADPIMLPLFPNLEDDHVERMALWLTEFFGGPMVHLQERGGLPTVMRVHRGLNIANEQREHWIMHMRAACQEIHMAQEVFDYFEPHIYFGAHAAQDISYR